LILPEDIANSGFGQVTLFNPPPGGGESAPVSFRINSPPPLTFTTKNLPDTAGNKSYHFALAGGGGIPPNSWSIVSGRLPGGLFLDAVTGRILGRTQPVSADQVVDFTVELKDSAFNPNVLTRPLSILVRSGALDRNDTCSGATAISNGRIRASISPYGDVDVYSFQGTAGKQVTIEIFAQRLDLDGFPDRRDSYLDSLLELLNDTCPEPQPNGSNALAFNDDIVMGDVQDSLIQNFTLPYTGTYYIRVRDFRGDGRPDLIYELSLSGAD
jgi:hypothetical protein